MSYRQLRSDLTPVSGLIASSTLAGSVSKYFPSQGVKPYRPIRSPVRWQSTIWKTVPFLLVLFRFVLFSVCLFVCFIMIVWFKVSLHPVLAYFSVFEAIKMSTKQLRLSMRRWRTCISFLLSWFPLQIAEPVLPYALAFAAGAMVYVVVDDIIPEAQTR